MRGDRPRARLSRRRRRPSSPPPSRRATTPSRSSSCIRARSPSSPSSTPRRDTPRVLAVVPDDARDDDAIAGSSLGSNPNPKPKPNAHRRVRSTPKPSVSNSSPTIVRGSFTFTSTSTSTTRGGVVSARPRRVGFSSDVFASTRAGAAATASFAALGWNRPRSETRGRSLRSTILRSTRIVATESTVRIPPGFERERRRARRDLSRDGSHSAATATDEDGERIWVLVDAATDASFVLAPPEGTAFDSNARVAFSPRRASRLRRERARIRGSRSTTSTASDDEDPRWRRWTSAAGKFLDARRERRRDILRVARRSRGDGEGSRRVFGGDDGRAESSRIESTPEEDVVAAGLADGRVALFRVRDDGGAWRRDDATLDVSRGWRHLDGVARAGSNPDCSSVTTATLFWESPRRPRRPPRRPRRLWNRSRVSCPGTTPGTFASSACLSAPGSRRTSCLAHVGEVTCIDDAGLAFFTGARNGATAPPLGRDAR